MKYHLSRKKARAMIALLAAGLALYMVGLLFRSYLLILGGAAAVLVGAFFAQSCPYCGKRPRYTPQWSERGRYYCSYCGERLSYDDEADET